MRHYASQKHHRRTRTGNKLSFGLRRHRPFSESHAETFIEKSIASHELVIVTYVWTIKRVRISPALYTSISIKIRLLTMDIRGLLEQRFR